jgi:hypothetical protein
MASRGPMLAKPDQWYALRTEREIWKGYVMIRVPRIVPKDLDPNFGYNDELARLEAERDQLRSVIAREGTTANWTLSWFHTTALAMITGFGLLLFLAEYVSATGFLGTVLIGGALMFILTLRVRIFGQPYYIWSLASTLFAPAEPNARDLLADCEYKISKLKDNRS